MQREYEVVLVLPVECALQQLGQIIPSSVQVVKEDLQFANQYPLLDDFLWPTGQQKRKYRMLSHPNPAATDTLRLPQGHTRQLELVLEI